jgi:tungstate transport system substrate-binding protein
MFDDGLIRMYRKVMFNRFVIAGPSADPAGLGGAGSAADAMARIARSAQSFVSRGDESGTHVRERDLWAAAGLTPQPSRLIETGQGMAPTLRVASERQAYVLTDEATLARLGGALNLRVVFEGGDALVNTYAVAILTTAPAASSTMADQLAQWLIEGSGRSRIDAFRIAGRQVFFVWPQSADASSPESMPPGVFTP